MGMLATLQETHDPKAPLSGGDLVSLLMEYCNNQIRENSRIEREYNKDITNDKIEIVMKGFGDGIAAITTNFNKHITAQNKYVNELEQKLIDLEKRIQASNVVEEKVTELNLKVHTYGIYHQQLLFNLKLGLQDSLQRVENDIKILALHCNSCKNCGETFQSMDDLSSHTCQVHRTNSEGISIVTPSDHPAIHPIHDQSIQQEYMHMQRQPKTIHCKFCDVSFGSMREVNIHASREHKDNLPSLVPSGNTHAPSHTDISEPQAWHPLVSQPNGSLACTWCDYTCYDECYLENHIRGYHIGPTLGALW